MSTSVALSASSSSWRNVLAPVFTICESMQGSLCRDGLLLLHCSKWHCLASTYASEIQDLIELVEPEYDQQMSLCNKLAGPLQALQQAVQDGEASMQAYIPRISEGNYHSWLVDKALKLGMSTDVVDVLLHDFLWASSIVREQVFRITGRPKDQEAHLLEQARKLHEIWLKEDADADLCLAKSFLIQLKGQYRDNDEICQLVDFILSKLSHIEEAAHNHVTIGSLPSYMCIHTNQCLQTNTEGIFRNDQIEVRKVMWLGGQFVLKSFKHMDEDDEEAAIYLEAAIDREAAIQARVWHPHVVPLVCRTSKPPGLLMELLQENLADLIKRRRRSKESESPPFTLLMAVDLMLQIAKGMEYLHSDTLHIIHRDLKPANILVSTPHVNSPNHAGNSVIPPVHLKVADFGVSKAKLDCSIYTTRDQGTTAWMAPEVYGKHGGSDESKYSNKADIYSFGIVCSEILTGKRPFKGLPRIRERVFNGERPPLPPQHCPPALSSFIQMCWDADPTKRPTFIQICRMLRYFKACILCDDEARLFTPLLSPAHIDDMIDHSLKGRTFQPKALGTPLEMYFYGLHFGKTKRPEKEGSGDTAIANGEVKSTPENLDALLKCLTQDVGFSKDRPVAACIIYKSLVQWRYFEAERTNVFDRIVQIIGTAVESQENNVIQLAYLLTNTSMLLFLLQRTLKASGTGGLSLQQVEAKDPALLFKQQLTAYVEKIYGMIRDNLKKEITPLLELCTQALSTSRATLGKAASTSVHASSTAQSSQWHSIFKSLKQLVKHDVSAISAQQILGSQWHSITKSLSNLLSTMLANHVSALFVRKVFQQIFSYINALLFNSLLSQRECCSFRNGEYLKAGLADLERWACEASEEYAGSAWDELKHLRQAVGFLVMHQKPERSLDELTRDLCPVLSIRQLYQISTMFWDDKFWTHSVSPEVIANMRVLMSEDSNDRANNSILLESDDSSIPFSVDDISKSMPEIDLSDVDPPLVLRENPAFFFLQPHSSMMNN